MQYTKLIYRTKFYSWGLNPIYQTKSIEPNLPYHMYKTVTTKSNRPRKMFEM